MSITRPDRWRRRAGGFSMVSAIFILVVLASLGAAIITVSTSQQMSSAADLQGSRAYWAARSAAESALMQLLRPEDTAGASSFADCSAVTTSPSFAAIGGFTIQVTHCRRDPAAGVDAQPAVAGLQDYYDDGGQNVVVYTVTASASQGSLGSPGYVEREVTLAAAKCKDPYALMPDGTADTRNRCS